MADKIKGISIEIGGDTKGLSKALGEVKKETNGIQTELRSVERLLKLDPKNTEVLAQKQQLLSKQVETTKDKLEALKTAKKKADDDMKNGTEVNEKQYRLLQREIVQTEQDLKKLKSETSKFKAVGDSLKSVGGKMTDIGKKSMVATGAIVGGMVAAAETTREYREDISRLETAFLTAGKTTAEANDAYQGFYQILGESDRSIEAVNHLAKLCNTEQELAMWSDICAGVSATFGDSLPIEGLTEAANETAKVAKVTGPLADALNWAGVSEEAFNEKLEKCTNEQQRSALITNTLNGLYKEASETFRTMNADVMASREANQRLTDSVAELGTLVEPIITAVKNKLADLLEVFRGMPDVHQKTALAIAAIVAVIPPLLILIGSLIASTGVITAKFTAMSAAIDLAAIKTTALNIVMSAGPYVAAAAAIGVLIYAMQGHTIESDRLMRSYKQTMKTIDDTTRSQIAEAEQANILKNKLYELENQINSGTLSEKEATVAKEQFTGISNQLNSIIPGLIGNIGTETNAYAIQRGEVDSLTQSYYNLAYAKAMANAYQAKIEATATKIIEAKEKIGEYEKTANTALEKEAGGLYVLSKWKGKALDSNVKYWEDKMQGYVTEMAEYQNEIAQNTSTNVVKAANVAAAGTGKAAKSAGKAVQKETKTAAEVAKEAFQDELKVLKRNLDMEQMSQEEYYDGVGKLRDKYFEEGSDDWWDYTVEIVKFHKQQFKELKDETVKAYDEIGEKATEKLNEIENKKNSFRSKLNDVSGLVETMDIPLSGGTAKGMRLTDWDTQAKNLKEYNDTLDKAKGRIGDLFSDAEMEDYQALLDIIRDDSISGGTRAANMFLNVSDEELKKNIDGWKSYRKEVGRTTDNQYADEVAAIQTGFIDEVSDKLGAIPDEFKTTGETAAQFFGEGFMENISQILDSIKQTISVNLGNMSVGNFAGAMQSAGTTINNTTSSSRTFNITTNGGSTAGSNAIATKKALNSLILQGVL